MALNVIVTGGGTGIGRPVTAAFATDGDTVVITGRRPDPLRSTSARQCTRLPATARIRRRLVCSQRHPSLAVRVRSYRVAHARGTQSSS